MINVDLPWNPAVLEQRIARAYRMGQKRPVDVFILVTEKTLEERMLATLAGKHELALAALDVDSDVDEVQLQSGLKELKRRLEVLLNTERESPEGDIEQLPLPVVDEGTNQQERLVAAGEQLFTSAIDFLTQLIPNRPETEASRQMAESLKQGLSQCVQRDERGRVNLSISLPDTLGLERLADSLARLLIR